MKRLIVFLASIGIAMSTLAAEWPPLPKEGFIVGRAAKKEDVDAGRAAFVAARGGRVIGTPLAIAVPQYAYFLDKGTRSPAIIIQAEEAEGQKLIGARLLDGSFVAGLITDFELLGSKVPSRAP